MCVHVMQKVIFSTTLLLSGDAESFHLFSFISLLFYSLFFFLSFYSISFLFYAITFYEHASQSFISNNIYYYASMHSCCFILLIICFNMILHPILSFNYVLKSSGILPEYFNIFIYFISYAIHYFLSLLRPSVS